MRSRALLAAAALAATAAGCGAEDSYENALRPPTPISVTGAITEDRVLITPDSFGAGLVSLTLSNQSGSPQQVVFETDELGGEAGGNRAMSDTVAPGGTTRIQLTTREGTYTVRAEDSGIQPAEIQVGEQRESAQDQLLLP